MSKREDEDHKLRYGDVISLARKIDVPLQLMDQVQRDAAATERLFLRDVPHDTDAAREARQALHDERDRRLGEAWRNPQPSQSAPAAPTPTSDAVANAYAAYDHALTNAWRPR